MPIIDKKQLFKRIEAFDASLEFVISEYETLTKQDLNVRGGEAIDGELAIALINAATNLVVGHNINHVGATIHHISNREMN